MIRALGHAATEISRRVEPLAAPLAGPTAGEVLSALAVAVHAQVTVDRLRHMIYAYRDEATVCPPGAGLLALAGEVADDGEHPAVVVIAGRQAQFVVDV